MAHRARSVCGVRRAKSPFFTEGSTSSGSVRPLPAPERSVTASDTVVGSGAVPPLNSPSSASVRPLSASGSSERPLEWPAQAPQRKRPTRAAGMDASAPMATRSSHAVVAPVARTWKDSGSDERLTSPAATMLFVHRTRAGAPLRTARTRCGRRSVAEKPAPETSEGGQRMKSGVSGAHPRCNTPTHRPHREFCAARRGSARRRALPSPPSPRYRPPPPAKRRRRTRGTAGESQRRVAPPTGQCTSA